MDSPPERGKGVGVLFYDRRTGRAEWRSGDLEQSNWPAAEQGSCSVRDHI